MSGHIPVHSVVTFLFTSIYLLFGTQLTSGRLDVSCQRRYTSVPRPRQTQRHHSNERAEADEKRSSAVEYAGDLPRVRRQVGEAELAAVRPADLS